MLRDRQEAEDALQETYVLLWKKADQYRPEQSSVFTWAVMLARGKAIDRLRSRQRRSRVFENATEPKTEPSVKPEITISGERTFLNETLRELPDEQREAIDLAFFSGLTHEEISSQLSQPLGTIKARIRRGLLKLRETFNQTS